MTFFSKSLVVSLVPRLLQFNVVIQTMEGAQLCITTVAGGHDLISKSSVVSLEHDLPLNEATLNSLNSVSHQIE